MANVTDAAFRRIIAKYGKPDVMYTEFVSAHGLCSPGRERLMTDLWFADAERPIVAQFFGAIPEHMAECARLARELGFDGVDINMGCPDRAVEKQGAGAALMKDPLRAQELIRAAKEGAGPLPVSVKTRIGYARNQISEWIPALLEAEPAAIILHARTRNEMSKVPAQWETVAEAVRLARLRAADAQPLILGNGDVSSIADARRRAEETGADGVMIGRGIFGNPWLFSRTDVPDVMGRLRVMIEHTRLFEELYRTGDAWGKQSQKGFDVMKKHYKAYVNGFDGAKELRVKLMEAPDADEVERIVRSAFPRV